MKNLKTAKQNKLTLRYAYMPLLSVETSESFVVRNKAISEYNEGLNCFVMSNIMNSLNPSNFISGSSSTEGDVTMGNLLKSSQGIGQKPTKEESVKMAELKAAQEKAAQEKAAQEKAAQEKAAQEKALIPIEEQVKQAINNILSKKTTQEDSELLNIYLPVFKEKLEESFKNVSLFTEKTFLNNNYGGYFLYYTGNSTSINEFHLCKEGRILPVSKHVLRFECLLCNSIHKGMIIEQKFGAKSFKYTYKKFYNETSITSGNRNAQVYMGKESESSSVENNLIKSYRAIIPFFKLLEKVRQDETDKEFKKADSKLIEKWEKEITSFITKKANRLNIELLQKEEKR